MYNKKKNEKDKRKSTFEIRENDWNQFVKVFLP